MNAQQREKLGETLRARAEAELAKLIADGHPNPAVRVWGMVPRRYYGAVLKSARSMKVLGYEVGLEKRWMPVEVAKRLVKAGHCSWGPDGDSDHTRPGLWISLKERGD